MNLDQELGRTLLWWALGIMAVTIVAVEAIARWLERRGTRRDDD